MPMRRVLAETDVASEEKLGEELGELLEGQDDRSVVGVSDGAALILPSASSRRMAHLFHLHGYTEENDAFQALLDEWAKEALKLVDAPSLLARERRDDLLGVRVIRDENRVHEHVLCHISSLVLILAGQRVMVAPVENRPICQLAHSGERRTYEIWS